MSKKLTTFTHLTSACNAVKTYVLGIIGQLAKSTADSVEELAEKNTEQDAAIEKNADDIIKLKNIRLEGNANGTLSDDGVITAMPKNSYLVTRALNKYYKMFEFKYDSRGYDFVLLFSAGGYTAYDAIVSIYARPSIPSNCHTWVFNLQNANAEDFILSYNNATNTGTIWYRASSGTTVGMSVLREGIYGSQVNVLTPFHNTADQQYDNIPEDEAVVVGIDANQYMPLSGGRFTGGITLPYIEIPTTGEQLPALRIGDDTHGYMEFDNNEIYLRYGDDDEVFGSVYNRASNGNYYYPVYTNRYNTDKATPSKLYAPIVMAYNEANEAILFAQNTTPEGVKNTTMLGCPTRYWDDLYVNNIHCTNPPWENSTGADLTVTTNEESNRSWTLSVNNTNINVSVNFIYTKINDIFVSTALTLVSASFALEKDAVIYSDVTYLVNGTYETELHKALRQKYFYDKGTQHAVIEVSNIHDSNVRVFIQVEQVYNDPDEEYKLTLYIANYTGAAIPVFWLPVTAFSF